jgi:FixJ family two-component response regulator
MKKQCAKINERRTVVVVDDDSHVLRAVERLIRSAGFDALTFESAELLVAAEVPKTITCLLLDVHMPGMNGVELFERLAADGRSAPVIMMTGRSDAQTQHLLQRVNASAVLFKPFDEDLLLDAVSGAFALSRTLDEERLDGPQAHNS